MLSLAFQNATFLIISIKLDYRSFIRLDLDPVFLLFRIRPLNPELAMVVKLNGNSTCYARKKKKGLFEFK